MANNPVNSNAHDEQDKIARELTRMQLEVTGLEDSLPNTSLESDAVTDADLTERLESAKRVMELLARMRPGQIADSPETIADQDTYSVHPTSTMRGSQDHAQADDSIEFNLPTTIGRFEIQSLIGQGGFGMVFLARDPGLQRVVALKVPTISSLLKEDARLRFQQEGRAVAALSHPNIVPIYEVGSEGPIAYLASEYIDGTDLSQWIHEQGPLESKHAAAVVAVIADAIQHAHLRQVIHRDLKPANVLLETNGAASTFAPESIRVTDFGLAKMLESGESNLTRTGCLIGTPAFSAPEQLQPSAGEQPSESADVYSLGAILYFLLTGNAPFDGENLLELIRNVQQKLPTSPAKVNPRVPKDLAAICLMALEKKPSDRYASAHQLREDLVRFENGESVVAHPVAWPIKLTRWAKRNPIVAASLSLAILAIAIGMVSTLYQWRQTQLSLAETGRQKDRSDRLLLKTEDAVDRMLTRTSDALSNLPAMTKIRELLVQDALEIQLSILQHEQENGASTSRVIDVYVRLAKIQSELGLFEEAKQSCHAAIQRFEQIDEPSARLSVTVSQALRKLGNIELNESAIDAAKSAVEQSLEILRQIGNDDNEIQSQQIIAEADTLRLLGWIEGRQNNLDAAVEYLELGIVGLNSMNPKNDEERFEQASELVSAYNSLAIIQKRLGKFELARQSYESSIAANQELISQAPWRRDVREKLAITSINFGNLVYREFEPAEAAVHYQRSAEMFEELIQQYPLVTSYQAYLPSALNGVSLVQKRAGDFLAARTTIEDAISKIEKLIAHAGPTTRLMTEKAAAYNRLASISSELEDYPATDAAFTQAMAIYETLVSDYPKSASFRYGHSLCLGNQGDSLITRQEYMRAAELLDKAIDSAFTAVELVPGSAKYSGSLQFIQRRQLVARVGAGQSEDLVKEILQQDLDPNSGVQWAICAAECIELAETESLEKQLKDFAFSQIEKAIAAGFDDSSMLETDERFAPLRSDPRFSDLLQ